MTRKSNSFLYKLLPASTTVGFAAILLAAGGLRALQNVLMIIALPFSAVIILMMTALYIEIRHEQKEMGLYLKPETYPEKDSPFRSYEDS